MSELSLAEGTVEPSPNLISGTWKHVGDKDVIGRGLDTEITLHEEDGQWSILFIYTHFPSVNEKDTTSHVTTEGPYPISAEKGVLTFEHDGVAQVYTYKLEDNVLVMPAFIEREHGEWIYQSGMHAPHSTLHIKLQHNHLDEPIGWARFPGVVNGNGYYIYEEIPASRFWESAQYLRLLTRAEGGQLVERARLIFDEYGQPRYEPLLSRGQRAHNFHELRHFFRVSDDRRSE